MHYSISHLTRILDIKRSLKIAKTLRNVKPCDSHTIRPVEHVCTNEADGLGKVKSTRATTIFNHSAIKMRCAPIGLRHCVVMLSYLFNLMFNAICHIFYIPGWPTLLLHMKHRPTYVYILYMYRHISKNMHIHVLYPPMECIV